LELIGVELLWLGLLWLDVCCRDLSGFGAFPIRVHAGGWNAGWGTGDWSLVGLKVWDRVIRSWGWRRFNRGPAHGFAGLLQQQLLPPQQGLPLGQLGH
jgi:hypothetical protein